MVQNAENRYPARKKLTTAIVICYIEYVKAVAGPPIFLFFHRLAMFDIANVSW